MSGWNITLQNISTKKYISDKFLIYIILWKAVFFKENCWEPKEFKSLEYKVHYWYHYILWNSLDLSFAWKGHEALLEYSSDMTPFKGD